MKKLMALLLSLVTVLSMTCVAFAGEIPTTFKTYPAEYEYFDDGSYIVTTITESSSILTRASGSKTASKTAKYYSSSGSALWSVTVTGNFSYTGTSATCKSASVSTKIYNSAWSIISSYAKPSGASATAAASAKSSKNSTYKTLTVTLTCKSNGTIY